MKILVTANLTPFMAGGADEHVRGLCCGLAVHGHEVELLRFPFRFSPEKDIKALMDHCEGQDFNAPNGVAVDRVISLQFPGYGVRHARHTVWIMHQHRAVYELYDQQPKSRELSRLRKLIVDYDNRVLPRARRIFANSRRVAERLKQYNGLKAVPLYHPPPGAENFYSSEYWDYIFCPSRLESLKRQELFIRAAALVKAPLRFILAGDGGQMDHYQRLINELDLAGKVSMLGRISDAEKQSWYAHSLAVFFGPEDEDYGYVTLEAMLSARPVITCTDSGGTLEFVQHGVTGVVVEPYPEAVAQAIEEFHADRRRAATLGQQGLEAWRAENITWENVVKRLLEKG